mmetsp:Transcript_74280/g.170289  ORF Transcript_74280/g.170289 Transcript_74280/m.170289 type:complete len:85 (+) Transcript_74280:2357-2611(+)
MALESASVGSLLTCVVSGGCYCAGSGAERETAEGRWQPSVPSQRAPPMSKDALDDINMPLAWAPSVEPTPQPDRELSDAVQEPL